MAETNNSFSTMLADFVRLQNNALEIIGKQSQAVVTDADVVQVTTTNLDGTRTTYTIPSFSGIRSSIKRIDETLATLMGFNSADAYIRMPDGSFKRIYQTKTPVDPPKIGSVTVPAKFMAENNWFFESLLSPALKVSFDVTKYIAQDESKIGVKRLIINTDTSDSAAYFDNNIKGKNDIDYVNFLIQLQTQNLTYFVDESIIDLPLSVVRYSGDFTIVSFRDQQVTLQDGTQVTKRRFLFNTLSYTDNLSIQPSTMTLKVGDQLIKGETLYEVTEVNIDTKYVGVKRLRGLEPIESGGMVSIYSTVFSPKYANVGVGFGERQVVFFKNVNDEANLISTKWSPGVSFFSNDLTIDLDSGSMSLKEFYQTRVMDFGSQLISASKNNTVSPLDGLTPDAPTLDAANFKVVQVNDHKLDQAQVVAIRKKAADKVRLESVIDKLTASIDKKKAQLNTTKFASDTERRGVKNELDSLIRERDSQSSLYASIINELAATAQNAPAALDAPKYRVRGFFNIPSPKYNDKTGFQNVIQFYVYYRYVNPAGNAAQIKQFDYTADTGETRRASFSNLVEVRSEIRKKYYSTTTGKYEWQGEDVENADTVNINQVDISISKGEKVEFYVVAVSEAGWPTTPLLSAPSNTITIEFPQDLTGEDEATIALMQASQQAVRVQMESDLAAKGLDIHLSSSFNAGEQYYAHSSDVISSSFYDASGGVISLYEKLKSMDLAIQEVQNKMTSAKGELAVYLIDKDNSTKTQVQTGATLNLFAGYYVDYVNLLPASSQRGAIINKIYTLSVENPVAATLELVSRFPGGLAENLPTSLANSDTDYANSRRYDIVPIVNTSVAQADTNNANKISAGFYQSGQLKSQFLYSRYTDIGLAKSLYVSPAIRSLTPLISGSGTSFVWNGTKTGTTPNATPNGNGGLTNFCIHTQHPALQDGFGGTPPVVLAHYQTPQINSKTVDGYPLAPEVVSQFRHAYNFNAGQTTYEQLSYQNNWSVNVPPLPGFPGGIAAVPYTPSALALPDKFGFINNDRYLIGKDTCGSYLFVAPATFDQLLVDGTDFRAVKSIGVGESNAIQIPILYQFRMTDYAGDNTGTGTGYVGGYDSTAGWTPPTQLNYAKKIGIDIYVKDTTVFSFDVYVTATYKRESLSQRVDEIQTSLVKTKENITYSKNSLLDLRT